MTLFRTRISPTVLTTSHRVRAVRLRYDQRGRPWLVGTVDAVLAPDTTADHRIVVDWGSVHRLRVRSVKNVAGGTRILARILD